MDPNSDQFSTNCPFGDNTVGCYRPPLPRSFTLACHESVSYGFFPGLSIILSPSQSFTRLHHEKQVCGCSLNLSDNHSRDPILGLLSVASVGENSRALVLSIIQRNQTRILFVWDSVWAFWGGVVTAYQAGAELNVAYTVIRPHSAMRCTFALYSAYLEDFYSFFL